MDDKRWSEICHERHTNYEKYKNCDTPQKNVHPLSAIFLSINMLPIKQTDFFTAKVVETAVFMDKSAYDVYLRFYEGDKQKIRNMILAFVNGMQAIYHYPKVRFLKKILQFVGSCYVFLWCVMFCNVLSCCFMLWFAMLWCAKSCYVLPCYFMSCHVLLCFVMLCSIMSCYVLLCLLWNVCHVFVAASQNDRLHDRPVGAASVRGL